MKKFPEIDMIAGVRVLDKSTDRAGATSSFRFEVWTKFSTCNENFGASIEKYLKERVISEIMNPSEKDDDFASLVGKINPEKMIEFK
jgi:hypothetical protein